MSRPDFGKPPGPRFDVQPTADDVAFFREHGFLVVPRITTDEELAWMRRIFEHVFSAENAGAAGAPIDRSGTRAPGEGARLAQSFFPEMQFPALLESNHWRNAKRFAAALLGVDPSLLSSWGHMIEKPPGGRTTPWHQDHAYWEPELDYHALGVWLPMHAVTVEMGCMQFIPGSHRRGLLRHRHDDAPEHNLLVVDEPFDAAAAVACPLEAGGATFHHMETLHYTAPNSTGRPRLAYPIEFQVRPVRRAMRLSMPWVDAHRAATGGAGRLLLVADGQVSKL